MTNLINFVSNGKKILGVALNYMDVVLRKGVAIPHAPVLFLKPTTSYLKEGNSIILPKVFEKVAYEVELGVIIGKECKSVSTENAMEYVGGYCLALDLTAQCNLTAARAAGLPWTLGKGFDTSTPVSRFIQRDIIQDPHKLPLWLKVNNEMKQLGCTSDLIFKVPEIISYASKYMTLEENDLILTGTCDGAAPFEAGDVIECGLGSIYQMKFDVCSEV